MLYPLSYEGLRPISYLPGRSQSCPGVPTAVQLCRRTRWERSRPCSEHPPSTSGANAARMLIGFGQASPLPLDAIGSPSTRGAHEST
jgi:hypothetical protein